MSDASSPAPGLLRPAQALTHWAALLLIDAAVTHAEAMGVPQVVAVVDAGCNLLAFVRMDGARLISEPIVLAKAATAASTGRPTGDLPPDTEVKLGLASGGRFTNLKGGVPVVVAGEVVGGIGVGSGTGVQDREVAEAAVARLQAALAAVSSRG